MNNTDSAVEQKQLHSFQPILTNFLSGKSRDLIEAPWKGKACTCG